MAQVTLAFQDLWRNRLARKRTVSSHNESSRRPHHNSIDEIGVPPARPGQRLPSYRPKLRRFSEPWFMGHVWFGQPEQESSWISSAERRRQSARWNGEFF